MVPGPPPELSVLTGPVPDVSTVTGPFPDVAVFTVPEGPAVDPEPEFLMLTICEIL